MSPLRHVEDLRELGLPMIPLGTKGKTPPEWFVQRHQNLDDARKAWPKSPRLKWKQYQTTPPTDDEVFTWVRSHQGCNWGIITGPQLVVVDADSQDAAQWVRENITHTPWTVVTGRGVHFWFQRDPELSVKNSASSNKIDIRGDGGYVVAPGSIHSSGAVYELIKEPGTESDELWQLPKLKKPDLDKISQLSSSKPDPFVSFVSESQGANKNKCVLGAPANEGERNNSAAAYIGALINQRLSELEIHQLAEQWNKSNKPPLTDEELQVTINSIVATHNKNHPESPVPQTPIEPTPLPDLLPVDPFPLDALPEAIAAFVDDVARRTPCPVDFVAVTALCALSAALGNKASIAPKQRDDWTVIPNLWGALIGRPSAKKSPAMHASLAPLRAIEDEWKAEYQQALTAHDADQEIADLRMKQAKQDGKKNLATSSAEELRKVFDDVLADKPVPPTRKRMIVNDPTVAKLGELMNENPTGLLLERDEFSGLLANLAAKEGQCDRAFYLQCFDGNGRFTVDRISRGTIDVACTTLSLVGAIQPSKLAPLVQGAVTGRDDDGLLQRLQLAVWPDAVDWSWQDRTPNSEAQNAYAATVRKLVELPDSGTPKRFTSAAQQLFKEWMIWLHQQVAKGDIHPSMESYMMKLPQTVASLALIFQLIQQDRQMVEDGPTRMAIKLAGYLLSHASRIYGMASNEDVVGAKLIHRRRDKLPSPFTVRDVRRKQWAGLAEQNECLAAIGVLVDHGYLIVSHQDTGGRPSTHYLWKHEIVSATPLKITDKTDKSPDLQIVGVDF